MEVGGGGRAAVVSQFHGRDEGVWVGVGMGMVWVRVRGVGIHFESLHVGVRVVGRGDEVGGGHHEVEGTSVFSFLFSLYVSNIIKYNGEGGEGGRGGKRGR